MMQDAMKAMLQLHEVSEFLYKEAELLSDRKYEEWLDTLAEDITYRMFVLRNLSGKAQPSEYLEGPLDISWFDEGKETITKRVQQIRTHQHWAEEPPSRTTRYLTNLRILETDSGAEPALVRTRCNFMVNRNRNEADDHCLYGHRIDLLARHQGTWRIRERKIYINQSTILMGNLSFIV
ncbi:3-phenylpropionate/cinnamic acid dioxygenase subunit beta [Pigmentiphaga sp. H8]|nr:3-phenylpropionate/cinnamic acid dioxygenase subunit beta [Pigmentiphaga sp. H8]